MEDDESCLLSISLYTLIDLVRRLRFTITSINSMQARITVDQKAFENYIEVSAKWNPKIAQRFDGTWKLTNATVETSWARDRPGRHCECRTVASRSGLPTSINCEGSVLGRIKKAIRILYRSQIDETSPFVHAKL